MLKIHRTSRDLLGSSLYAYNLHGGKITWEILRKMRYFLHYRKYLPLTAAESLISLCLSHPFLGMLSVPGWYLCSRPQWVIYFLLTDKEEGLYQDADCWTVLIASLLALWRELGEEAWGLVASGLTLSKHTEKDWTSKHTEEGERERFSCNTLGIGQFPWQQTAVKSSWHHLKGPWDREDGTCSQLCPQAKWCNARERLGGHAKQKHPSQVLLSAQPYLYLFFASWMTVGMVF